MGKPYPKEKYMTDPVIQYLQDQRYVCETELCCGYGRHADIIAVKFNHKASEKRMEEGPISPLGAIGNCSTALLEGHDWWPHFDDVIAIELKLSKYKQAIRQARAYSREVMRSYICLPDSVLEGDAKLDTIYQACNYHSDVDIGLWTLGQKGDLNKLKQSSMNKYVDALRIFWQVEKLWMKWRDKYNNE